MMNLYCLERKSHYGYDTFDGFVIAAASDIRARQIAAARDREDKDRDVVWMVDADCNMIGTSIGDEECIILESFNAG